MQCKEFADSSSKGFKSDPVLTKLKYYRFYLDSFLLQ